MHSIQENPNDSVIPDPTQIPSMTNISEGQEVLHELMWILDAMGVKAQVFYREEDSEILLEIRGNNLGIVIGKHGQTLDALEFILNLIHKKKYDGAKELVLDVEGYREKKMDILRKLVRGARDTVLYTQREIPLEPMPPADRKIIHLLCRDLDGITSESRGEGSNRRVFIRPLQNDREETRGTIH